MYFLKNDELHKHIKSQIHQNTQQHASHYDFTVKKICAFNEAGSLDFGGGEFKEAKKKVLRPQKQAGDDFGWWNLSAGYYQATLNETIEEIEHAIIMLGPHPHVQKTGIIANSNFLPNSELVKPLTINFAVPDIGCKIKENARFAVLYLIAG